MASWWSWGDRPPRVEADAARVLEELERRWGPLPSQPESRAVVAPGDPTLVARLRDRFGAIVRDDDEVRLRHAIGQSYPELRDARRGVVAALPAAVLTPTAADQVSGVLRAAGAMGLALLPYGGGTSVTGGVAGPDGPYAVLSLRGLRTLRHVDRASLVATADAGMTGVELEDALAAMGLTLGHYPQSFERSTVGGWVATRSVGQLSTGVGAIADLVAGMRAVAPSGDIVLPAQPRASEGPELREILLGSEGRFAVITDAALRIRPRPETRRARAWRCASFADGTEAIRRMLRAEITPSLVRLSDEPESAMLGLRGGALLLTGVEGTTGEVAQHDERVAAALGPSAVPLDPALAERWYETRFDAPYLRDALLERDVVADSLETAALWSDLAKVYDRVRVALATALDPAGRAVVLCHISHAYAIGASLYFTFLAPGGDDGERRWRSAKRAALDAIVASGGAVSHHHGIGRDHREWLARRYGTAVDRATDALALAFDPERVLAANRAGPIRTRPEA